MLSGLTKFRTFIETKTNFMKTMKNLILVAFLFVGVSAFSQAPPTYTELTATNSH